MLSSRILLNFVSATAVIIIIFLEELGTVSSLASGNNAYKKPKTNQKQHISSSSNQQNSELQAAALLVATLVFTAALTHYVNLISQSKRYFPVKGVTLPSLEKTVETCTKHRVFSLTTVHLAIISLLILVMVLCIIGCCLYLWHGQQLYKNKGRVDEKEEVTSTSPGRFRRRHHHNHHHRRYYPEPSTSQSTRSGIWIHHASSPQERSISSSRTVDRSFRGFTAKPSPSPIPSPSPKALNAYADPSASQQSGPF